MNSANIQNITVDICTLVKIITNTVVRAVQIEMFCLEENVIFLLGKLSSSEQEEPLCFLLCFFDILFCFGLYLLIFFIP